MGYLKKNSKTSYKYDPFDGKPVDLSKYYRRVYSPSNYNIGGYCSNIISTPQSKCYNNSCTIEPTFSDGIKNGGLSIFGLGSSSWNR